MLRNPLRDLEVDLTERTLMNAVEPKIEDEEIDHQVHKPATVSSVYKFKVGPKNPKVPPKMPTPCVGHRLAAQVLAQKRRGPISRCKHKI